MDLKFSFGGASPDHHGHGDAPSGIPLPFPGSTAPVSHSTELDVVVRLESSPEASKVIAEVITGDGVTYSRGEVGLSHRDATATARATRSAAARAVAGLEGPLATAITAVKLQLPDAAAVIDALGIAEDRPEVTEELQTRTGIAVGTPILAA